MKKILFITAVLTGLAATGFSQERPRDARKERVIRSQRIQKSPDERARLYTEGLDKRLNLTDRQEKEVYRLQLKNIEQRQKADRQRMERHQKELREIKAQRQGSEKRLNRILSDEQRAVYGKLREDRKDRMEARKDRFKDRIDRKRKEGRDRDPGRG